MKEDLEDLRRQTEQGDKLDTAADQDDQNLVDAIAAALEEIDDGDRSKTIAFRDDRGAALLGALEDDPEAMADVAADLAAAVGREPPEDPDRSTIVRLAWRAGMGHAAPAVIEQLGEATAEHARRNL